MTSVEDVSSISMSLREYQQKNLKTLCYFTNCNSVVFLLTVLVELMLQCCVTASVVVVCTECIVARKYRI